MQINLPEAKYRRDEDQVAFHEQLKPRIESLPGVERVTLASALPTWGFAVARVTCELEGSGLAIPAVSAVTIGADYFHVMRAELRRGRAFHARKADAVIVNEAFVQDFFAEQDLLGKHLLVGSRRLTVIGIAANIQQDVRHPAEREPSTYTLYDVAPKRAMFLAARTSVPPAGLAESFRRELRDLDENIPAFDISTLAGRIAKNRLDVGAICVLLTVFAGIALVLAFVGLYAVVAHAVSQRTQEIGIRTAMGASPRDILILVVGGLRPVMLGLLVGVPAALGVGCVLRMALVGVSSTDPMTFTAVVLTLVAACFLGCAIPARRAVRVDPVIALRCD